MRELIAALFGVIIGVALGVITAPELIDTHVAIWGMLGGILAVQFCTAYSRRED